MRYFLHIAYNGYFYRGWQRQPNVRTVQEVLENILSKILKETIICYGCGRTDAQVHADQYVLHINTSTKVSDSFTFILNKNLPNDIVCYDVVEMDNNQHARYDALKRTYDYFMHFNKDPSLYQISSLYSEKLDIIAMQQAVLLLPQYTEFRAYCLTPDKHNHTKCAIYNVSLLPNEDGSRLKFSITANRFLKSMIRLLVGALIEIGRGELSIAKFEQRLITGEYHEERFIAFPQGLHLSKLKYSYIDFEQKTSISLNNNNWIET